MNRSLTSLWGTQPSGSATPVDAANEPAPDTSAPVASDAGKTADEPVKKKRRVRTPTGEATDDGKRRKGSSGKVRKETPRPLARLSDLGGIDHCIEEVLEFIAMPIAHPEIYLHTGVQPPRGILLHGPPGCGKTLLANAIAGELGVPFYQISAPSVVSGMSGESEKKIRDIFEEAAEAAPCLLFIDEIDAITPKRETAQREMERRIVAQLLTCMDDLSWDKTNNKPVMIVGATNRPDSLDPALRRAGRFDREISMGVPDQEAREKILRVLTAKLRLAGDFDFRQLAKSTPGYVGADLNALTAAAGMVAVKRIFRTLNHPPLTVPAEATMTTTTAMTAITATEENNDAVMDVDTVVTETASPTQPPSPAQEATSIAVNEHLRTIATFLALHPNPLTEEQLAPLAITSDDFLQALTKVQPSSKREGFATVPDVTWTDIGALDYVRDELRMAVVEPIKHPEFFEQVGIVRPAGVLLWGPPGCGKTLLAKAVANESRTNFISVKGPELLNKYVGESERAVRQVFARARASSPCVVFFDELDALCSRRDDSQSEASARVVNTLLTELDGVDARKQVFIIAATNRPDIIDGAMLRPGRLDKLLYVELPVASERTEILRTLCRSTPLADDVRLETIAADPRCEGFSGADLASLVREAGVAALRSTLYAHGTLQPIDGRKKGGSGEGEDVATPASRLYISHSHFETAFGKVSPSLMCVYAGIL
ncbi:ribosome biogenesis ATPase RIX7 [Syncephalis pseudoplumigaleata]|uniref:Ribosome biogenesis ATPase RIX7 n=1 Tax=Syncephalis pseudoplumigaleata TaxID=1712513 RepID=A0A4P9Z4Q8_9FUNG|nr:ribosome biogenesis ATPase RIX7 [Syncephalis pseudoplumigaleata]|eukprot:RKP26560.1 ribosome biogenesis ATPase RIX7 [Syncephalis pseudoplumigaleata]